MLSLSAIVPSLLWLWLFWHLHYTWSLAQQYNYGWAVPFLALFLFYQRWQTQPAANPIRGGALVAMSWLILLVLLPVRIIEEANPDWRLLSWVLALLVVAYSVVTLLRLGGKAWLRHFAFPVFFPLVAVPWFVQVENGVVHGLTRAVASIAVEVAGWFDIPAFQVGNVIQLANGFVGVDEACSGVKTLQASLMVSLFLGELLALSVARRIALLALGCAWVFACNVVRATTLVVIAARDGIVALDRWHDFIGTAVLVLGMGGLMVAGFLLARNRGHATTPSASDKPQWTCWPMKEAIAGVLWLTTAFLFTEFWYRAHERDLLPRPAWQASWPAGQPAPIADSTRAILQYNDASSAMWTAPEGGQWWGFFARWEPGRAALQLVRSHSPEICLPAVGRTFRAEVAPIKVMINGIPLTFRVFEFEQNRQPLFVFVAIEEDKAVSTMNESPVTEWNARGRLIAAFRGRRNLGQRLLELAALGYPDYSAARGAFEKLAREIVRSTAAIG